MTEGDLHGKESQEGRQESSQEGQVTRTRIQIRYCKGATATRGAFFVRVTLPVLACAGFQFTLSHEGPVRLLPFLLCHPESRGLGGVRDLLFVL